MSQTKDAFLAGFAMGRQVELVQKGHEYHTTLQYKCGEDALAAYPLPITGTSWDLLAVDECMGVSIKSAMVLTAVVQMPDPLDERGGVYFSQNDLKRMAALPAGTELYAKVKHPLN